MTSLVEVGKKPRRTLQIPRLGPLWLALPGVIFLLLFLIWPSLRIFSLSLFDRSGAFSFSAFARFFGSGVYNRVLLNTFNIAFWTTAWCLVLGYPLAYWLAGLSKRSQQILSLVVLLSFWSSTLVKNFTWLILLGRNGFAESVMQALGFSSVHFLFNRSIVIFAMVHTLLPLAVVTMLPVMNQLDRRLTLAAATLGADRAQAFWRVFFIQSMRGVAAAGLLVFISSLGFFITPTFLGSPREMMLGQMIIMQINELQNWQLGSALAVVLVLAALISCIVYNLIFGLSSLAGESQHVPSSRSRLLRRLGLWLVNSLALLASMWMRLYDNSVGRILRINMLGIYACFTLMVLLFPVLAVIPMSFTNASFLTFPPQGFSLKWFEVWFNSPLWVGATIRSFGIGIVVGLVTCALGAMAALSVSRSQSRVRGWLFFLFLLPMMIPSIVIAIALFYFAAQLGLVATNTGIAIGHVVIALPMVFVILLTTFQGHDWRLDHAAATLGASKWQVLRRITLPSIKGGLAAAFVIGFLTSFEELTVALFMGGGMKTTIPKQMWDDILLQVSPTLAAASTMVLLVVIVLFAAMQMVKPRSKRVSS
ncbi:ABC transporter permease subunit [Pantoea sp. EA-12]|uniref:ABC transporter permease subunit n=1 Tax=Pantoea sp. EA-12 TaxID=3043303 RepID=UPI0024B56277|nr:ABC transporter permease subunit [Pantoea sp. EA-12]MDI9219691.1 ABC transporter permease subunit [Pantoea sp. EA-12]